jgi:hypothetical protein
MNLFSEAVAVWVQAIGSILAIVAGFAVAIFQVRAARRENQAREDDADRNARQAALALAALALECCEAVRADLFPEDVNSIDGALIQRLKRRVEATRQMLAAFPIASLKLRRPIECYAALPGLLDWVADNLREVADTTVVHGRVDVHTVFNVRIRIGGLCEEAKVAVRNLEAAVAESDAAARS